MDTLVSMRVFRQVVDLGSFVGAAQRLQISTAMASKHVMNLERRLGTRLLNRSSRHLSLTEAGSLYLDQCRDMLDTLDEVEATVGRSAVIARGTLRISAPAWFANPRFARVLADYQATYPEVILDIDLSGRMVNLVEEGFDLALRVTQNPNPALIARPLCTVRFHLVAAPSWLARHGTPQTVEQLSTQPFISYSLLPVADTMLVETASGQQNLRMQAVMRSNTESLSREAVLAGMGLAFLPEWLVDDDLAAGRLQRVMPDMVLPIGRLNAIYASRRYQSSKVRTFLDFISQDGRLG